MSPRKASDLTLEHVLLALIDARPMHGYELYQELCVLKGIALVWNIKQALLYAILDKLEGRGLLYSQQVPGETHPPRKYFHITDFGKHTLQTWYQTPVRRARDMRQEFLAKLIVARRYGKAEALGLIHSQEGTCQAWAEDLAAHVPPHTPEQMDAWIVYSFRVNRVEAVLRWLKVCAEEVEQIPA
jgi:PadR family transcriptional regulator, regulatory protein AphA